MNQTIKIRVWRDKMIGDLILCIKGYIKQAFCVHDYTHKTRECGVQVFEVYACKKCGRVHVTK